MSRWPAPAEPITRIAIAVLHDPDKPAVHDLSAVASNGPVLYLGADESAHVEIVRAIDGQGYGTPDNIALSDHFDLPDDADELDIEGLAVDGGQLWIVGSHSLARRKLKAGAEETPESLARIAKLKECPNRAFLGRVELGADGRPTGKGAMLAIRHGEDALKRRLADDAVLAPFLAIPAKENGLDIEGIAVAGERVTVGLRGPVVGGWACLIDVPVRDGGSNGLKLDGDPVKHWLDLDGLGVRDLKRHRSDLLILAGPSMAVSGPSAVYRWAGWAEAEPAPSVERPELIAALSFGYRCDHPEALLPIEHDGRPALLILHDNPHPDRLTADGILADVIALP